VPYIPRWRAKTISCHLWPWKYMGAHVLTLSAIIFEGIICYYNFPFYYNISPIQEAVSITSPVVIATGYMLATQNSIQLNPMSSTSSFPRGKGAGA
jgi:hypothetical protein